MPKFTDENIERLFGAEDAENEDESRFKEYFYSNKAYENLQSSLPIRLLVGHKGVGKSALLKRAFLAAQEQSKAALWITPSQFAAHFASIDKADFNQLVELWKSSLATAIFSELVQDWTSSQFQERGWNYLFQHIGTVMQTLLSDDKIPGQGIKRVVAKQVAQANEIEIYIDDLDRGWDASKQNIHNISALLTAIRDITGANRKIKFRLALRSDVYFLVRTSDESTDKIERNLVWLEWTNHEILCVIAKRIATYFGDEVDEQKIHKMAQKDVTDKYLAKVMQPRFSGAGHWSNRPIHNVLLSLTRRRPRDLVKLMHASARNAYLHDHEIISSGDLESSFASYSEERLQDIVNEFKSEVPNVEALLLNMKPTARLQRTAQSFQFSTDVLVQKLKNVMQNVPIRFSTGRPVSPRSVLAFLYKIDFITARKQEKGHLIREYFDQRRFLASEYTEFGFDWEIHPAYRWALQPQNLGNVIDGIDLESQG